MTEYKPKTDERTKKLAKRFYKDVGVQPTDNGYGVTLDGRAVMTPGRQMLELRTEPLANAIADEWAAQTEHIDPKTMPLTQIGCTAIDRIAANRAEIEEMLAKYAETDLVCYRATSPADLAAMQHEHWQPLLDWCGRALNIQLDTTDGLLPIPQAPDALQNTRDIVQNFDDHELSVISVVTHSSGSLVIALALANGFIASDDATTASQVDEIHQSQLWGLDHEAEVRLESLRADIKAAEIYLDLHRARNSGKSD